MFLRSRYWAKVPCLKPRAPRWPGGAPAGLSAELGAGGTGREGVAGRSQAVRGGTPTAGEWSAFSPSECRDVLLPLLIDQLSGQLDDNSSKPDHEASSQLLSYLLEVLDRKDVVSQRVTDAEQSVHWSHGLG